MKKLMTVFASAATLCAFGVTVPPAGFEGDSYVAGEVFDASIKESGESRFWYSTISQDDGNVISNYVESGTSVPALGTDVTRPDDFIDQTNSKFLRLETSAPLFRSVEPNNQDGTFTGVNIPEGGIYLDTLVKFSAADEEFAEGALGESDKIAIEYVEHEALSDTDTAWTNFVIRAGYVATPTSISKKNYRAAVPADFNKDEWHRLTVRTIADINGSGNVGFVVYLDQTPLEYSIDETCGEAFSPSPAAQNFYNGDIHAVYPSAVATGNERSTIAAVSFSGSGCIDDVVFTTETPAFITEGEAVVVPFTADAGVTAISVAVDGVAEPIAVVNGTATLPALTTAFTVTATVNTAEGYEFVSIKVGETTYNTNPASVTGYAGDAITITTARNNFSLFDANGEPITGTYQTLTEALAVAGVAKIQLAHNYDVAESEGDGFVTYDIGSNITLDLNGNTITGGGEDALFTVGSGVTMIVIDSLAANTGKIDYTGTYAVFYSVGDVVIGATTGDYGPTIDGYLAAADDEADGVWLVKAKIEAATNSGEGTFLWNGNLGNSEGTITSDADLDSDEEYWVVAPQGGSEPVEVSFSVEAADANSSVVIKINDELVAYADLPEKLTTGDTYEVTYTAAQGYYLATEQGYETEHGESGTVGTAAIVIEAPGVVAIATVPEAASNLVYDGTEQTGVPAGTGYTLANETATNAGEYTATATLDQGYVWSDTTTEAKSINWSIAPKTDAAVVVALTSEIAEYSAQLEFPTASATIGVDDVAGTPAWDPATISEPEAGATNTYTVTFTVTTANYAGSIGTATFKVYKAAGGEYPTYIDEITDPTTKEAYETKYDTWKATYEADATSTHKAAFLLNIAPNAEDQTLEPASITMEGGKVVISANQTLTAVNGKVYVKVATTLSGLGSAKWTEATLNEGKVQVTPGSSDTAGFYKIKVDF